MLEASHELTVSLYYYECETPGGQWEAEVFDGGGIKRFGEGYTPAAAAQKAISAVLAARADAEAIRTANA
jgi:hypothetical protein